MNKEIRPLISENSSVESRSIEERMDRMKAELLYQNVMRTLIYRQYPIGANIDLEL